MKGHTPRLSIGLPVYNGERYLAQVLDDLLAQTFADFEIIVSDNASTDRTPEICASRIKRDPRVRYFKNTRNVGAINNFNRVFHLSKAPLFKWVASDDVHRPTYLQKPSIFSIEMKTLFSPIALALLSTKAGTNLPTTTGLQVTSTLIPAYSRGPIPPASAKAIIPSCVFGKS